MPVQKSAPRFLTAVALQEAAAWVEVSVWEDGGWPRLALEVRAGGPLLQPLSESREPKGQAAAASLVLRPTAFGPVLTTDVHAHATWHPHAHIGAGQGHAVIPLIAMATLLLLLVLVAPIAAALVPLLPLLVVVLPLVMLRGRRLWGRRGLLHGHHADCLRHCHWDNGPWCSTLRRIVEVTGWNHHHLDLAGGSGLGHLHRPNCSWAHRIAAAATATSALTSLMLHRASCLSTTSADNSRLLYTRGATTLWHPRQNGRRCLCPVTENVAEGLPLRLGPLGAAFLAVLLESLVEEPVQDVVDVKRSVGVLDWLEWYGEPICSCTWSLRNYSRSQDPWMLLVRGCGKSSLPNWRQRRILSQLSAALASAAVRCRGSNRLMSLTMLSLTFASSGALRAGSLKWLLADLLRFVVHLAGQRSSGTQCQVERGGGSRGSLRGRGEGRRFRVQREVRPSLTIPTGSLLALQASFWTCRSLAPWGTTSKAGILRAPLLPSFPSQLGGSRTCLLNTSLRRSGRGLQVQGVDALGDRNDRHVPRRPSKIPNSFGDISFARCHRGTWRAEHSLWLAGSFGLCLSTTCTIRLRYGSAAATAAAFIWLCWSMILVLFRLRLICLLWDQARHSWRSFEGRRASASSSTARSISTLRKSSEPLVGESQGHAGVH